MSAYSRAEIRAQIERDLAAGHWAAVQASLQSLWCCERNSASASYIVSTYGRLRGHLRLTPCRLAVMRGFVVEPAIGLLRAGAFLGGIDLAVQISDYGNYAQQILDSGSALYAGNPDVVLLAVQTRDVLPQLWEGSAGMTAGQRKSCIDEVASNLCEWVKTFRSRSGANLIIHNFERPARSGLGILDAQHREGETGSILRLNEALQDVAAQHSGVYILDYDGLVSRWGREEWFDEQKWLAMRMPIAANRLGDLAQEWLRFLHPLAGRIGKVLVTDLDGTLWGGVLGEDGIEGILINRENSGIAYHSLQRALLDLYHRGILLAIASKNDPDMAMEALSRHPEMLLRPEHFAAIQIDWNPKAENLRKIAEGLNVGLDSLVFLDDNPVERQSIHLELPEVAVIELPAGSQDYAEAVRDCPLFERVTMSEEDRNRSQYYGGQKLRENAHASASSLEEFYYSLEQRVEIAAVSKQTLARAAQLVKKTNQFNMTTRRHSEAQIAAFASDPECDVLTVGVRDRFGDNGIVGLCIVRRREGVCEIDSLLLSCRVIGRTVETAILSFLVDDNRAKGIRRLEGRFLPTAKNRVAESFFPNHGFELNEQTESGSVWSLDLQTSATSCPPWIKLDCRRVTSMGACAIA